MECMSVKPPPHVHKLVITLAHTAWKLEIFCGENIDGIAAR